jgi:hypothetical protein
MYIGKKISREYINWLHGFLDVAEPKKLRLVSFVVHAKNEKKTMKDYSSIKSFHD